MNRLICLILLAFSFLSCEFRSEDASFVSNRKAGSGVYTFKLDLSDSLKVYHLSVFSRTRTKSIQNLEIDFSWISPSGVVSNEKVYMREVTIRGDKELYRDEIMPSEYGLWRLEARPRCSLKDIEGIGVVLGYGTR